jgi:hypothetical protein
MKFGLNFFPSFRAADYSTAAYFAQCLRLVERADRLGFNSVKAVEHYFYDYGGHSPNPVVFLAAVAARTHRIRPITGAVIPAFNNPVKLAAELAVLDNLSNGRLDVGFGRAFIPKEFEVFGVSMDEPRPVRRRASTSSGGSGPRIASPTTVSSTVFATSTSILGRSRSLTPRSGSPRWRRSSRSSGPGGTATT